MMQINQRSIGNMRFGYLVTGKEYKSHRLQVQGHLSAVCLLLCLLSSRCLLSSVRSRFRCLCYRCRLFRCSVAAGRLSVLVLVAFATAAGCSVVLLLPVVSLALLFVLFVLFGSVSFRSLLFSCLFVVCRLSSVVYRRSSAVCRLSSVFGRPSTVVCRLSFVVCRRRISSVVCCLSSVDCRSSYIVCRLSSVVRRLLSVVRRPSFVVYRLSSVVCRPSTVVCRISSVVCRLSSVVCRLVRCPCRSVRAVRCAICAALLVVPLRRRARCRCCSVLCPCRFVVVRRCCVLVVQLLLRSSVTKSKTSWISNDRYERPQKRKHHCFTRTKPFS